VRVFYGRQDGGPTRGAWEQNLFVAPNTNFNPMTFTVTLTNLVPNTNYFFRFYATNSSGEVWAPAPTQFTTAALDPAAYGARLKIAFSGYNRGEALVSFPVLVRLSTNLAGFSYRQFASATGGDLRFADAGGLTPLPFEIDEWNTNGTSSAWVRVPQLASTNDYIWANWGNPLAPALPAGSTNGSVWAGDHLVVYHLKESGFPYADSALQHPALTGGPPTSTAGIVGRGGLFDGVSDYLDSGTINLGNTFTLSAWVNIDSTAMNIQTLWANKGGGYATPGFALFVNSYMTTDQKLVLETGNGTSGADAATGTGAVPPGQWHQVTAVVDRGAGNARLFVDGVDQTQTPGIRNDLANQADVNLGRFINSDFYFKGVLDETRIEAVTRSSNWVWASWMTVASNAALAEYASVAQQPLTLFASTSNKWVVLAWPAFGVGAALYVATNQAEPVLWFLATNAPALVGSQWQVIISAADGGPRFYRLLSHP
jgi:hypothetical protein